MYGLQQGGAAAGGAGGGEERGNVSKCVEVSLVLSAV
eukprot:COSAG02_NODE_999_length_15328_cov_8.086360_7_plen_37_part_00